MTCNLDPAAAVPSSRPGVSGCPDLIRSDGRFQKRSASTESAASVATFKAADTLAMAQHDIYARPRQEKEFARSTSEIFFPHLNRCHRSEPNATASAHRKAI